MKQTRLFFIVWLGFLLGSCSSGNNNNNIPNLGTYGNLQGFPIELVSYSTKALQSLVQPFGVCPAVKNPQLCSKNYEYIQSPENNSLFNQIQLDSFVTKAGVDSVTAYRVTYNTPGQSYFFAGNSPSNETVSGLILVPNTNIQGVVLYYHPTVLDKNGVPSFLDKDGKLGSTAYNLAAIYASQGYIVVAPDYVGQGVDAGVMHPYAVYPQVNALSGIYMLNAAEQFLTQKNVVPQADSLKLYISSYSEGGAYAVWASRFLQGDYAGILNNNKMNLKRTFGIAGAYNLSGVQIPYGYQNSNNVVPEKNNYFVSPGMTEDIDASLGVPKAYLPSQIGIANFNMAASKTTLASYAFAAFINYNYNNSAYNVFFKSNTNFLAMNHCLNISDYLAENSQIIIGSCSPGGSLQQLFMNPALTSGEIGGQIIASAMGGANLYTNGSETFPQVIESLVTPPFAESNNSVGAFANQIPQVIMDVIAHADTWQFTTTYPISLVYMKYDSTVPNVNSKYACSQIIGQVGITPQSKVPCSEIDNTKLYSEVNGLPLFLEHGAAEFISNLVALTQIQQDYP